MDVPRAHLGDPIEGHHEVVIVFELLANELLRLVLVRRDEPRLSLDSETKRLTLCVENDVRPETGHFTNGIGVEPFIDAAWKRAGKDNRRCSPREIAQLVEQRRELALRDLRAPLVDLGVGSGRRVDNSGRGS